MPKYFAYGSNLNQGDLDSWCKKKGFPPIKFLSWKRARLEDYALVFNVFSRSRNGGVANTEFRKGEFVEGVLFEVKEEDLRTLDEKEGSPGFYERIKVLVKPDDGRIVKDVITYAVPRERTKPYNVKPTKDYLHVIIEGARKYSLSEEWIKKLAKVPTKG